MKISEHILNTTMSDDQKGHIEVIARRNGIAFLDRTLAMTIALQAGHDELLYNAASFAMVGQHDDQDRKALFLDKDDGNTPLESYFIALHELGHIILGHHTNNEDPVENEIEAWEWALSHTQHEADDDILLLIQNCLATYCDGREAEERPESLLSLTNPDTFKNNKLSINDFIKRARAATGDTVTLGERQIPIEYARMIADWISESRKQEQQTLRDNVEEALEELKQKAGLTPP